MKNQLATLGKKNKKEFKSVKDISRDPAKMALLQNYIDEAVKAKHKILDEQQQIKSVRENATEETGIDPKEFSFLVGRCFNNDFAEKKTELEALTESIDVIQNPQMLTHG